MMVHPSWTTCIFSNEIWPSKSRVFLTLFLLTTHPHHGRCVWDVQVILISCNVSGYICEDVCWKAKLEGRHVTRLQELVKQEIVKPTVLVIKTPCPDTLCSGIMFYFSNILQSGIQSSYYYDL